MPRQYFYEIPPNTTVINENDLYEYRKEIVICDNCDKTIIPEKDDMMLITNNNSIMVIHKGAYQSAYLDMLFFHMGCVPDVIMKHLRGLDG